MSVNILRGEIMFTTVSTKSLTLKLSYCVCAFAIVVLFLSRLLLSVVLVETSCEATTAVVFCFLFRFDKLFAPFEHDILSPEMTDLLFLFLLLL